MKRILTLSLLASSVLLAATPNIGDIEKQVQPPKDLPKEVTPLVEIGGVQKYAPPMQDDKSGKSIAVKSFKITGAIHITEAKLQTLISAYSNKDLNFQQLQEVASIVTKEYRNQGYFVARAYLPVQNIEENNGVITIAIIEGNYGKFDLKNNSLVKDSVVQGMLDDAKRDNIVSTNTLERAMLIINDTAGVKVTVADVKPGSEVGTSDFAIQTEATSAYSGYILADNYGSRYTGKNRLMAGMSFNSLAGIGDKLTISGLVSNGADLKNGRVGYLVPLMPNGLTGEVGYSQTAYSLTDKYESLDAIGDSKTIDATLTYPIIRTRLETLKISSTLSSKDMKDEQASATTTNKDITSLNVALTHSKNQKIFGVDAVVNSNLTLTTGKLEESINNVSQRYNKLDGYINSSLALSNEYTLSTNLSFQKDLSSKNLDGSEDMSIGGSNGVKVFPDGELSAENGLLLNLELFKTLPSYSKLSHKLGFFYDIGRATMEDSSTDLTFEKRTLQDAGIGYYASYDSFFAKAQLARVVGGQQIENENVGNTTRLLVQAGFSF